MLLCLVQSDSWTSSRLFALHESDGGAKALALIQPTRSKGTRFTCTLEAEPTSVLSLNDAAVQHNTTTSKRSEVRFSLEVIHMDHHKPHVRTR